MTIDEAIKYLSNPLSWAIGKTLEQQIADNKEATQMAIEALKKQKWIPVTEIPPRGRDLMLKIYDKHNLFYYYHMGFHDGEKYYTYNFFWQKDKDLEIVGWQLCPWEER